MRDKVITALDVLQAMEENDVRLCTFENLLNIEKVKAGTRLTFGVPGDHVGAIASGRMIGMLFFFEKAAYSATLARLENE